MHTHWAFFPAALFEERGLCFGERGIEYVWACPACPKLRHLSIGSPAGPALFAALTKQESALAWDGNRAEGTLVPGRRAGAVPDLLKGAPTADQGARAEHRLLNEVDESVKRPLPSRDKQTDRSRVER